MKLKYDLIIKLCKTFHCVALEKRRNQSTPGAAGFCHVRHGHCLPGFPQSFWCGSPQSPPKKAFVLWPGQVVHVESGELAHCSHPEDGDKHLLFQLATCHIWMLTHLVQTVFCQEIWTRSSSRSLPTCHSTTKATSVDDPRLWEGTWQRVATKKWSNRLGIISQQQHNEKRLWVTQHQNYIPYKSLSFVFLLGSNFPFMINY